MGTVRKKLKYESPLELIIPPIMLDIIRDHARDYAKKQGILNYKITFGTFTEFRTISFSDSVRPIPRNKVMSNEARIIEANLFEKYNIDESIYTDDRSQDIIKFRHRVQFFMIMYANMSLLNIGKITGGKDHSSLSVVKMKFCKKILKNPEFKREMIATDLQICAALNLFESKLFDKKLELKTDVFKYYRYNKQKTFLMSTP